VRFEAFCFGSIHIDGITYHHDVVIDRGKVRKRKKKLSKKFRHIVGHTPLFDSGEDTLEVWPAGDWYRNWCFAGYDGRKERSQTSKTPTGRGTYE